MSDGFKSRQITEDLIFHSDRGIQYACTAVAAVLNVIILVRRSMNRKGNCWDNEVAESL
jgi:transposase InsO family protein